MLRDIWTYLWPALFVIGIMSALVVVVVLLTDPEEHT